MFKLCKLNKMTYYINVYTTLYSESKDLDNLTTGKADFIAFTSQVRKSKYIQQLLSIYCIKTRARLWDFKNNLDPAPPCRSSSLMKRQTWN